MATHTLTDSTFKDVQDIIYELSGIYLNDTKREMVLSRLSRVVNKHKFKTIKNFVDLTKKGSSAEKQFFINILTTNKTSFFRESYHFDIFDKFIKTKENGKIDVWCSAASTGEEPYSISIILKNHLNVDHTILATDIDTKVLLTASQGIYTDHDIENCMTHDISGFFDKTDLIGKSVIKKELKENLTFKRFNLTKKFPGNEMFDVIWCRNVMIYFEQETQRKILEMFKERLRPGGILFIGHSENFTYFASDLFRPIGKTTYAHAEDQRSPIEIIGGEL